MHTGLEDCSRDFPGLAAYFSERAARVVGLIVTGGFSPNLVGWDFAGADHVKVVSYLHVLEGRIHCGPRVALIGAGGIGFDVAEFLAQEASCPSVDTARWMAEWASTPALNPVAAWSRPPRTFGPSAVAVAAHSRPPGQAPG